MADSGVREIQLSGKQLVFFFMASVVLIVAVFLLGVSVGRGARTAATEAAAADLATQTSPAASKETQFPPPIGGPGTNDPTTYPAALRGSGSAPNAGKTADAAAPQTPPPATAPPPTSPPVTSSPATQSGTSSQPAPKTAPVTPPPSATPATSTASKNTNTSTAKPPAAPPGSWWVAAGSYRSKDGADSVVTKLKAKGYQAFIVDPTKPLYSVRVGPYPARSDAEAAADKMKKDGVVQSTFVTR